MHGSGRTPYVNIRTATTQWNIPLLHASAEHSILQHNAEHDSAVLSSVDCLLAVETHMTSLRGHALTRAYQSRNFVSRISFVWWHHLSPHLFSFTWMAFVRCEKRVDALIILTARSSRGMKSANLIILEEYKGKWMHCPLPLSTHGRISVTYNEYIQQLL